jgi:hypothetical protein
LSASMGRSRNLEVLIENLLCGFLLKDDFTAPSEEITSHMKAEEL